MTMKRALVTASLLFLSFTLYSEDGLIGLSNKTTKSKNEVVEKVQNKNSRISEDVIHDNPVIPKSFYIGELGDFYSIDINRNSMLKQVDIFITSIKNGTELKRLDPEFSFIFNSVYKDTLLKSRKDLTTWNLGYVSIEGDRAWLNIELHFREKMSIGVIYLEKRSEWFVTDLQLQDQEEEFFDPSSPNRY